MQIPHQKISLFQKKILSWYSQNKRDLPWRQTRDPYAILVSEVMSQQTQISRVLPKFTAWMKKFPTIQALADAKISDGKFPDIEKELLKLPGIGQYTARAVLCFAFNKQIAVVDTNVRKIIVTQFEFDGNEKELYEIAEQLLPKEKAYDWNQALMDYAATVLKKEKIIISKQSKFVGSHRYYRGQILKKLLDQKKIQVSTLGYLIKKDYKDSDDLWLQTLLNELIAEGFILINKGVIQLAS